MQAGIPNPREIPKNKETGKTKIAREEMPMPDNVKEETIPVIIHKIRNLFLSNRLSNEAPANADRISAEK